MDSNYVNDDTMLHGATPTKFFATQLQERLDAKVLKAEPLGLSY